MIVRFSAIALAFGALLVSVSPADAGKLTTWQMSNDGRRLSFKTDGAVQPKAMLLFSPTRLIVDLPGTIFPRPTVTQNLTGYYNTLRVGQFDPTTTRLVLEVRQGYTLNPKQITFTGYNPIDWAVDLPTPIIGTTPAL
jgi:N-acetylmuramoyl-L-alanine amidase